MRCPKTWPRLSPAVFSNCYCGKLCSAVVATSLQEWCMRPSNNSDSNTNSNHDNCSNNSNSSKRVVFSYVHLIL